MSETQYSMSFTSGTLLYRESIIVAELFMKHHDWNAIRGLIISENRLQMRTMNANRRIWREVSTRLKQLTIEQLQFLTEGDLSEQNQLLWLAVCKRYHFIRDFAVEVVREKFLRRDMELSHNEYDIFFNNKAEWHPEVEQVADSTRQKQRQVVFKMMREAGLLTDTYLILPTLLSAHLENLIQDDDPTYLAIYPRR